MDDEKWNPIDFWSWAQRSRSTLATCWHDADYSFSQISVKFHKSLMIETGTISILSHEVKSQCALLHSACEILRV